MTSVARCYCGAQVLHFDATPQVVAFCHCVDCRRWTGAPAPAFAAFGPDELTATPPLPAPFELVAGVQRWNCSACGSPLLARFDYLPDQLYVPVGVLENAGDFAAHMHCHADSALPWLHIADGLPRHSGTARTMLNDSAT